LEKKETEDGGAREEARVSRGCRWLVFVESREQTSDVPSLTGGTWRLRMGAVQEENKTTGGSCWWAENKMDVVDCRDPVGLLSSFL
jgi:hypothetical protein